MCLHSLCNFIYALNAQSTCKCRRMFTILCVWLVFELNPHWSLLCLVPLYICVYRHFTGSHFAPAMCVAADAVWMCSVYCTGGGALTPVRCTLLFENGNGRNQLFMKYFFSVSLGMFGVCVNLRPVLRDGSLCTAMRDAISSKSTVIRPGNGR